MSTTKEISNPQKVKDLREGMRFLLGGKVMTVNGLERVGSKVRFFLDWKDGDQHRGQIFLREGSEPVAPYRS